MAKPILKTLGGKPKQVTASGVTCGRYPPLEGHIPHLTKALALAVSCGGPSLRELSGGNWMTSGSLCSTALGPYRPRYAQYPPLSELLCPINLGSRQCGLRAPASR